MAVGSTTGTHAREFIYVSVAHTAACCLKFSFAVFAFRVFVLFTQKQMNSLPVRGQ